MGKKKENEKKKHGHADTYIMKKDRQTDRLTDSQEETISLHIKHLCTFSHIAQLTTTSHILSLALSSQGVIERDQLTMENGTLAGIAVSQAQNHSTGDQSLS